MHTGSRAACLQFTRRLAAGEHRARVGACGAVQCPFLLVAILVRVALRFHSSLPSSASPYAAQLHRRQQSAAQLLEGGREQLGRLSATARAHLRAVLCECLASLGGGPPPPPNVAACRSLFVDGSEASTQMEGALTEVSSPLKPPPAKRRSSAMAVRPLAPRLVASRRGACPSGTPDDAAARTVTDVKHARPVLATPFTCGNRCWAANAESPGVHCEASARGSCRDDSNDPTITRVGQDSAPELDASGQRSPWQALSARG